MYVVKIFCSIHPINPAPFYWKNKSSSLSSSVIFLKNQFISGLSILIHSFVSLLTNTAVCYLFSFLLSIFGMYDHSLILQSCLSCSLPLHFHIYYKISLISTSINLAEIFTANTYCFWKTDIFQYCLPIRNMVYSSFLGLFVIYLIFSVVLPMAIF